MDKEVKQIGQNYFLFENGLPKLKLNETSAFIIERKLNGISNSEIAQSLANEYDIKYEVALNDVSDFLSSIEL